MTIKARKWLHGLVGGSVGAAASAIYSSLSLMLIAPDKFNLQAGMWTTIKTALVLGILTGFQTALAYLKNTGLPFDDEDPPQNTPTQESTMKKTIPILLAAVLCCGFLATGCATSESGKRVVSLQKAQDIAPALAASVSGAVLYGASKDPNAVRYAGAVKEALRQFILSDDMAPAKLQAAITALPIKELKTPEAQMLMTPIFLSYKVFADQRVKAGLTDNEGLKVLVQAVIDGIQAAQEALASMPMATLRGTLILPMDRVAWADPGYPLAYWSRRDVERPMFVPYRTESN